MAFKNLQFDDLEVVRNSIEILKEIRESSQCLEDIQDDLPREIVRNLLSIRKKMSKLVQAKNIYSQSMNPDIDIAELLDQIAIYLDIIDVIDKEL